MTLRKLQQEMRTQATILNKITFLKRLSIAVASKHNQQEEYDFKAANDVKESKYRIRLTCKIKDCFSGKGAINIFPSFYHHIPEVEKKHS